MTVKQQSPSEGEIVSAEVLLRSESGRRIGPDTVITATNINEFTPSAETTARASAVFEAEGFKTSAPGGLGFSITGPASLFERVFATRLSRDVKEGVLATGPGDVQGRELSLEALPGPLRDLLVSVTFSEPPAFGPSDY